MTAGELLEHASSLPADEPVYVNLWGERHAVIEIEDEGICTDLGDEDPAAEAYNALEELRGFTGTKSAMLKIINDYFGD